MIADQPARRQASPRSSRWRFLRVLFRRTATRATARRQARGSARRPDRWHPSDRSRARSTASTSRDQTTDSRQLLIQGRLVRINRVTFELEPWLAERVGLEPRRPDPHAAPAAGLTWSDGTPFTSADVLFSLQAVSTRRPRACSPQPDGRRPADPRRPRPTRRPSSSPTRRPPGPGVRLLDGLPILPKHKLEAALAAGTLRTAWDREARRRRTSSAPARSCCASTSRASGWCFDRNPRYWRKAADGEPLPYLDRIVLEIVPDQNAELLRLQAGATDLTQQRAAAGRLRAGATRARKKGKLTTARARRRHRCRRVLVLPEAGGEEAAIRASRSCSGREFRQAHLARGGSRGVRRTRCSWARRSRSGDRSRRATSRGSRPNVPRYPHDEAKARALLKSIGLEDRNGNGMVEDAAGTEARFTVITQRGIGWYERGTAVLRDELATRRASRSTSRRSRSGRSIQRLQACDYDAIYMRPLATDLDPAGNLDFWLSSGVGALLEHEPAAPATDWERRIDTLMLEQAATTRSRSAAARCSTTCSASSRRTCRCCTSRRRACTTPTARRRRRRPVGDASAGAAAGAPRLERRLRCCGPSLQPSLQPSVSGLGLDYTPGRLADALAGEQLGGGFRGLAGAFADRSSRVRSALKASSAGFLRGL